MIIIHWVGDCNHVFVEGMVGWLGVSVETVSPSCWLLLDCSIVAIHSVGL